ncbi:MAG: dethiobiotin synthase [Gammaproteobacteria bacterium]|nr:dethiobiotin synthase [Gammaproteobacteria bacterium]
MSQGYFITGTDTHIGKSIVSASLLHGASQRNLKAAGMKPVATGCLESKDGLRNEDAEMMIQYSTVDLPYELVNPYAFEPPVSPHLAAKHLNEEIRLDKIVESYQAIKEQADMVIVEGVGGWMVPINETELVEDIARAIGLPLLFVVGTRLGCINHALLTMERIKASGLPVAGWIANIMDRNIDFLPEVIDTLRLRIDAPLVGIIPPYRMINPERASEHLSLDRLLGKTVPV